MVLESFQKNINHSFNLGGPDDREEVASLWGSLDFDKFSMLHTERVVMQETWETYLHCYWLLKEEIKNSTWIPDYASLDSLLLYQLMAALMQYWTCKHMV